MSLVAAATVSTGGFGPLAGLPLPVQAVVALLALDLLWYGYHRAAHTFSRLWRVHGVHHSPSQLYVLMHPVFHPLDLLVSRFAIALIVFKFSGMRPDAAFIALVVLGLQTTVSQNTARMGLSFQATYTFSKSIDDTSAVPGGISGNPGVILQTLPQDPFNPRGDKGPSTFDVTHVFTLSLIQSLPLDRVRFLQPLGKTLTKGWQFLDITTLTTGPPFTVYSGVQQTGAGGAGATDRPDLLAMPNFSTGRTVREDSLPCLKVTVLEQALPRGQSRDRQACPGREVDIAWERREVA